MGSAHGAPLVVTPTGGAQRLERIPLASRDESFDEAWLRDLIQSQPDSLPIDQIEPGFQRLVPICTELPTKHGPIDNFFMTPAGDIVLVEVKLWRNPEARRKVVAQALDYASCVFEMDYADLETQVRTRMEQDSRQLGRLYDLVAVSEADLLDEPEFIDAVNANLRRGRALILVVGDGIRTETSRLTQLLQSHAGAHFTFALIEMSAYRMPENGNFLICPRILARTEMISRGVVQILDDRVQIDLPPNQEEASGRSHNITEEQFYTAMTALNSELPSKMQAFLEKLEPLGIYPSFQRSLNLKWDPPEGKPINFGYIKRDGQLWTDASNWFAPKDISHVYNEELAAVLGLEVDRETLSDYWHVRSGGKAPRIQQLADRLDLWIPVMERFIDRIRNRLSSGTSD